MKIRIWSDLHADGAAFKFTEEHLDEVLVLAGDITNSVYRTAHVVNALGKNFKHVILVFGNHEYYHGQTLPANASDEFYAEIENKDKVHLLNPGSVTIDGVLFIGATLWSDFNKGDPLVKWAAERGINDFRLMKTYYDGSNFVSATADWMIRQHKAELMYIRERCKCAKADKIVVVTHFPPIRDFQHAKWGTIQNNPLNGYFMSDLDYEIMDLGIGHWICGHTHDGSQFIKHDIQFLCNPRGYMGRNGPENVNFDQNLVITV